MADDRFDLVIVGMGSGGTAAAEFAASLDLRVAVVERARVGGDRLWTGCVPSKALLASARVAHTIRHADRYGLGAMEPVIDLPDVWKRLRAIQHEIAATDDDPNRFRELGIDLVFGTARLTGPNEVAVAGADVERRLATRFVLLCTGSRPALPDLPGLTEAGFLTSETWFELDDPPRSVVMLGGGPVAVELAQASTRLGIRTTLLQRGPSILPRDEPVLVDLLQQRLVDEGVDLRLAVRATAVRIEGGQKAVHAEVAGAPATFRADELLVATGRTPNVDGLGLDELGIVAGPRGLEVDDRGRTSVRSVYAAGDVAGRQRFTHSAAWEAVRAVRDAFFPGKGTAPTLVPWCTFTDPELAHVGLTIAEAEAKHGDGVDVWRIDLAHNDRARADGAAHGAVVVVTARGRVVGAHVLAPAAGEMIHELALAARHEMRLADVAALVHVYPTVSTATGQLAGEAVFEKAQKLRWLVKRGR
jgi:pyruvate/2-oxoglutarate dehydrogenase complex dihydrolipoamide dehydrogenase (E3) component